MKGLKSVVGILGTVAMLGIGGTAFAQGPATTTGGYCYAGSGSTPVPEIYYANYTLNGANYDWTVNVNNVTPGLSSYLMIDQNSENFVSSSSSTDQQFTFTTPVTSGVPTYVQFEEYNSTFSVGCLSGKASLTSSLPFGQMPEVPFAVALPALAMAVFGAMWYRKRSVATDR